MPLFRPHTRIADLRRGEFTNDRHHRSHIHRAANGQLCILRDVHSLDTDQLRTLVDRIVHAAFVPEDAEYPSPLMPDGVLGPDAFTVAVLAILDDYGLVPKPFTTPG